jgi:N-acetylmuramoyl-L-alanine amidase
MKYYVNRKQAFLMSKGKKTLMLFLVALLLFLFSPSHPDSRVEVYNLRYHTHPSFTRIVIDVGKLREYTFNELKSPNRIYVDIYQAKLNSILNGQVFPVKNDYLNQIRLAQKTASTVRCVVELDLSKAYYRVWHLPDPFRIIIDIYPSKISKPSPPSMIRQLGLVIRKIVIDPGHGGEDPGCAGKSGLREKDVVLDVAKRLKKILESKENMEVILTRESDIFIPVENRTVVANQSQADLFISIHANASRNSHLRGVETFYLNLSQDSSVVETAVLENATSSTNISQMGETIKKILQNSKIPESKELAEAVQNNLVKSLSQKYKGVNSLGVKGGPFWVLIGADVPSILAEISFLSHPEEESRLMSSQYLELVAQGIYEGIMQYKQSLEKGTTK